MSGIKNIEIKIGNNYGRYPENITTTHEDHIKE